MQRVVVIAENVADVVRRRIALLRMEPISRATEIIHTDQAVMFYGGSVDYFRDAVFNYPTLAEAYKVAALDGINKLRTRAVSEPPRKPSWREICGCPVGRDRSVKPGVAGGLAETPAFSVASFQRPEVHSGAMRQSAAALTEESRAFRTAVDSLSDVWGFSST